MYYFCTYFDNNYLPRFLALHRSLCSFGTEFRLWALCFDAPSYDRIVELRLPGVEPVRLEEFERANPELVAVKGDRSRAEYYFTCTPSLPLYVLDHWPEVDLITYLDADLYFFAHPRPVFEELGEGSVAIIGHRLSRANRSRQRFGIYNVGWVSFRRDAEGLRCLRWWRERCIEWCHDRVEEHRYADQKYLDDWPERFGGVRVLQQKGANLAPWNIAGYRIRERDGRVLVDEDPLIFFHFQGFQQIAPWLYNSNFGLYHTRPTARVRRAVIAPYITALRDSSDAAKLARGVRQGAGQRHGLWRGARNAARVALGVVNQEYVMVLNGRVL
jgi:hypothetical protein